MTKLRKEYKQYEDRRGLLATYDLFLADERILPLLPNLLGAKFFNKKKQPVPVCLTRKNLKQEIAKARDSTYLHLSQGPCCAVRIARTSMSREQVAENIMVGDEGHYYRCVRVGACHTAISLCGRISSDTPSHSISSPLLLSSAQTLFAATIIYLLLMLIGGVASPTV